MVLPLVVGIEVPVPVVGVGVVLGCGASAGGWGCAGGWGWGCAGLWCQCRWGLVGVVVGVVVPLHGAVPSGDRGKNLLKGWGQKNQNNSCS